ncbi:MAG: hypothetical protein ACLRJY_18295, partial [Anaerobutyricum soehngenii]
DGCNGILVRHVGRGCSSGKDLSVYTRLEEIYVPMDRMILRSGRAVQVTQIGEKWVEIKSQGKIGYILRSDFDEYFSEISLNIG